MDSRAVIAARRRVALASRNAAHPRDLFAQVAPAVAASVVYDAACWHTDDPATGLITAVFVEAEPPGSFDRAIENELWEDDVHKFAALAESRAGVGVLSEVGTASPRLNEIVLANGFADELRAVFVDAGARWGSVSLFREHGRPAFSPEEASLVAGLAPAIAAGLRTMLAAPESSPSAPDPEAPGVVVLRGDAVEAIDPRAHALLDELGADFEAALPGAFFVVAAEARSGREDARARLRVRTPHGRWLVLHGTLLDGTRDGRVAVIVEPAGSADISDVVLAGHGLTSRERDVVRLVLSGASTAEIAGALFVSPWTVQDHLKSVFAKLGVRTRRELAARLLA